MANPLQDPLQALWTHAFRAHLDALVLQFEAQVRQHTAAHTAATERERSELRQELTAAQLRINALNENLNAADKVIKERTAELTRARGAEEQQRAEIARLKGELASLHHALRAEADEAEKRDGERQESIRMLKAQLSELGQQVQTLDEQFVGERAFIDAAITVTGSALFEATQSSLGANIEPTAVCMAALKSRKLDVTLAQALRERGRTAIKAPLSERERIALRWLSEAAGCELIEVAVGARFSPLTMEKMAERSDPSEEDMVLECLIPGLRIAGTEGSIVHPRVVVGSA